MRLRRLALCLLVSATGCPSREVSKIDPTQAPAIIKDIPVEVNRDLDILFVVDNSNSMGEEQASLGTNFPNFVNVLEGIEGGLPNIHMGVVSSNVGAGGQPISACTGDGDNGRLQNAPRIAGCSPPNGTYIIDVDNGGGGRMTNYSGTLSDTFACIAQLGTGGCGFEQHFESMKRALDGSNPENAGFLRDSAHLAVIFIADEDDCSATSGALFDPTQDSVTDPLGPRTSFRCSEFGYHCDGAPIGREPRQLDEPGGALECEPIGAMSAGDSDYLWHPQVYVDFLRSLKPTDPLLIIVAGIVGNPDPVAIQLDNDGNPEIAPSCVSGAGEADPGIRQKFLMDSFPNRNTFTSICNTDLSDALTKIAELLARVIGNPCIEGNIDLDPGTPGIQYECSVSDVQYPHTDNQTEQVIPHCDQDGVVGPDPCWYITTDAVNCADTPNQATLIVLPDGRTPPSGTHVMMSCVTL